MMAVATEGLYHTSHGCDKALVTMANWASLQTVFQQQHLLTLAIEPVVNWRRPVGPDHLPGDVRKAVAHIRHPERRACRLAGRIAARRACTTRSRMTTAHHLTIESLPSGKPVFPNQPNTHLSITHAAEFALACVGNQPMGIDMEKIEHRPPAFIRYFFTAQEQAWLHRQNFSQNDSIILVNTLWTRKEAISKLLGEGGRMALGSISVLPKECPFSVNSYQVGNYVISLAMSFQEASR